MPVEIRELQITTIVKEQGPQSTSAAGANASSDTDKIVAACVEQVMELLKQKTER